MMVSNPLCHVNLNHSQSDSIDAKPHPHPKDRISNICLAKTNIPTQLEKQVCCFVIYFSHERRLLLTNAGQPFETIKHLSIRSCGPVSRWNVIYSWGWESSPVSHTCTPTPPFSVFSPLSATLSRQLNHHSLETQQPQLSMPSAALITFFHNSDKKKPDWCSDDHSEKSLFIHFSQSILLHIKLSSLLSYKPPLALCDISHSCRELLLGRRPHRTLSP